MRLCAGSRIALLAALVLYATSASAQVYESVGTRAQGMGGAFVGVADDATASWWNPAGLATGALFNVVLEKGAVTQPADTDAAALAERTKRTGFAAAFPSLGISSYRLQVLEVAPIISTATGVAGRQPEGGERRVRQLSATQFGLTVGQSLGDHWVVASTLKLVRGGVASAAIDSAGNGLDRAADLDSGHETHGDLDVGTMVKFGGVQVGAAVRNVARPHFGSGDDRTALVRQARVGGSFASGPGNGFETVILAADADLTRTPTLSGDVRHVAAGVEAWFRGHRLGLRGGVTGNTVDERRPSFSTGVSVGLIKGLFIEAAKTIGTDDSLSGWASSLRLAF